MGVDWIHTALGVLCVFCASALLLFSLYSHETTSCCSNWPRRRRLLACILGYYQGARAHPQNSGWLRQRTPCLYLTLALLFVSLFLAPASGALVYMLHAVMVAMSVGVYCARTMAGCICSSCKRRREQRVWSGLRKWYFKRLSIVKGLKQERRSPRSCIIKK